MRNSYWPGVVAPGMVNERAGGQRVLVISGSTRGGSTNTALCRTAELCAPSDVVVQCYADIAGLPQFNPDDDREPLPRAVAALRSAIASADAVLFCTPEYAGTLPGSFKNLLDWTVGDTALTDKPVAWAAVAPDPRRGQGAHSALATVLGYVQARVIDDACQHVPIPREAVGPSGVVTDPIVRAQITRVLRTLLDAATT